MRLRLVFVLGIVILCGCRSFSGGAPVVIKDVDFKYETTWKAVCAACLASGFELRDCNVDERRITSYYKILPEADITDPWMRSHKAIITLVPKEAVTGVKYDISISVGLYWKKRTPLSDAQEGWDFISWDKEKQEEIAAEFHNQTARDERIKQGIEEFKRRTGGKF